MDAIKIAKVEDVLCRKSGSRAFLGTLHLTAHHLIFKYADEGEEETWIPYPLISLVTRLPQSLSGQSPLSFHCRNFRSFTFIFKKDSEAADVFDSVRDLTVVSSVSQLYAFFYAPNPPLSASDGWTQYSPRQDLGRMGVGTRTKAWRFTNINKDYSFSSTYPSLLAVPTRISDSTLQYASKYRTKCRIPALVYLHWANFGTITRSSQPMVGLTNNRSIQDEKIVEAIFQSHHSPETRGPMGPVYGATATNLIIDARPTANAMAQTVNGAGTENMDHYKEAKKAYLGVENIHVMRDSLSKVTEALREADALAATVSGASDVSFLDRPALRKSGWLRHISAILDGTLLIVKNIHVNSSHVLIHCSDGWDRTAQLSSLSQLCLDPYYRTVRGFQMLVEKDWLSFGHKFLDRSGHLSSDKFFLTAQETSGGAEAAQAFFASVQNRIGGQQHIKEVSPVFHQWLECVRQIQRQYPERFEFNSRFLEQLHYHVYSCQFGSFLFNCERERKVGDGGPPPCTRTISIWDFFNSSPEAERNLEPNYDATLDDPARRDPKADMGVLLPNPRDVRFWHQLYGRTDEEMNGRMAMSQGQGVDILGPIEGAQDDPAVATSIEESEVPLPPSPSPSDALALASSDLQPVGPLQTLPPRANSPSTVELGTKLSPGGNRRDSFRPFGTATSSYSLQTQKADSQLRGTTAATTREQTSPRPRPKAADLFSSGNMKSMWGKLSSNASAALTVVQGAYDGVSKDFKGLSVGSGYEDQSLGSELGAPGTSSVPIDESDWTSQSSSRSTNASSSSSTFNLTWRASGSQATRLPSMILDNPWGTSRATPAQTPRRVDDIFAGPSVWADDVSSLNTSSSGPLPVDPTVADIPPRPTPRVPSHTSSTTSSSARDTVLTASQSSRIVVSPPAELQSRPTLTTGPDKPPEKDVDPLGVGVW